MVYELPRMMVRLFVGWTLHCFHGVALGNGWDHVRMVGWRIQFLELVVIPPAARLSIGLCGWLFFSA